MNRKLFLALFLGVLMGALDIAVLGPALPAIRREFQTDTHLASWLVTVYVLANLVGTPLLGAFADRAGRSRGYQLSVALFALGSAGVIIAPGFATLLLARALQGFGSGGVFPVASAVIGDTVAPERRGRVLGAIGASFGIAFLVGPPLGSLVLAFADWRWIFAANLPLSALVLWWSSRHLPTTRPASHLPLDAAGIALFATGLGGLALAASAAKGVTSPVFTLAALGVASAAFALLPAIEKSAPAPLLSPILLRRRAILVPLLLGAGAGLGEVGVMFLPEYAVQTLGVAPSRAGFLLVALVLGLTVGAPLAGRLSDRFGARPVVFVGTLLQAAGLAVFALDTVPTGLTWHLGGPVLGLGLAALLGGPLRHALLTASPRESRSAVQALLSVSHSVGQIGSAALLGAFAGRAPLEAAPGAGMRAAFMTGSVIALAIAPLAALLPASARDAAGAAPDMETDFVNP